MAATRGTCSFSAYLPAKPSRAYCSTVHALAGLGLTSFERWSNQLVLCHERKALRAAFISTESSSSPWLSACSTGTSERWIRWAVADGTGMISARAVRASTSCDGTCFAGFGAFSAGFFSFSFAFATSSAFAFASSSASASASASAFAAAAMALAALALLAAKRSAAWSAVSPLHASADFERLGRHLFAVECLGAPRLEYDLTQLGCGGGNMVGCGHVRREIVAVLVDARELGGALPSLPQLGCGVFLQLSLLLLLCFSRTLLRRRFAQRAVGLLKRPLQKRASNLCSASCSSGPP
eukprot:jgi/Chrpa1/15094/Chrysochromulina_OHIO_Genome00016692-RA